MAISDTRLIVIAEEMNFIIIEQRLGLHSLGQFNARVMPGLEIAGMEMVESIELSALYFFDQ